jgi:hypothetical protein
MSEEGNWQTEHEQRAYSRQNLKVMCDEGSWFILYGLDLASGIGGYGETPEAVMADFKLNWERYRGGVDKENIRARSLIF